MLSFLALLSAHAVPLTLEPAWQLQTGPVVPSSLAVGPDGLAVRTTSGDWVGVSSTGTAVSADPARLGWWNQVGPDGAVVFGRTALALVEGGRARVVDHAGERTVDNVATVVMLDDGGMVAERPAGGLVGFDAAGHARWEVAGHGRPVPYDDLVARVGERGIEVFDGVSGRLVDVVAGGAGGVGSFAPFAGCTVVVPGLPGHPTRCWRDQVVVWEASLRGLMGAAPPVVGDLGNDGTDEVVVVGADGMAFVLDAAGEVSAEVDLGPVEGTAVVWEGHLVVAGADAVVAYRWGPPRVARPRVPPAVLPPMVSPPDVARCFDALDASACTGVGEASDDERGAAGAFALGCALGDSGACRALADRPSLAAHVDDAFWERGCRLGDEVVCMGWVHSVAPDRRADVAAFACSRGATTACSFSPAPPVPPRRQSVVGTVVQGGEPLVGARVRTAGASVSVDKRGRFALDTTDAELTIAHPSLAAPVVVAVAPRVDVSLEPTRWLTGRVEGSSPPAHLELGGCGTGRVAVQDDGAFVLRGVPSGSACTLSNGAWSVVVPVTASHVVVPRVEVEVPAMRVLGPDGDPLADVELSFGSTGADGMLTATTDSSTPCMDGTLSYEGYLAVCQLYRWPVRVVGDGPVLLSGGREIVAEPGPIELEPGAWTLTALDGEEERRVRLLVNDVTAVAVPTAGRPAPTVQVVTAEGWPAAGVEVRYAAGTRVTGADGRATFPGLAPTDALFGIDGVNIGRPRDRRLVRAPVDPHPIRWEQRPLGLVALDVDQARVDLFPGDVLREACGAAVHDLSVQELQSFAAGCTAKVWRDGRTVDVLLP